MAIKGTHIEIVKNDLPAIAGNMDKGAERAVRETVLFIEGQAKSTVPIGPTGALGGGIQSDVARVPGGWMGTVYDPIEYAPYVNYGTGSRGASSPVPERPEGISYTGGWLGMTSRPFMSQAAADGRPKFMAALAKMVHA